MMKVPSRLGPPDLPVHVVPLLVRRVVLPVVGLAGVGVAVGLQRRIAELAIALIEAELDAEGGLGKQAGGLAGDDQLRSGSGRGGGRGRHRKVVGLAARQGQVGGGRDRREIGRGRLARAVDVEIDVGDVEPSAIGLRQRDQRAGRQADRQIVREGRAVDVRIVEELLRPEVVVLVGRDSPHPVDVEGIGRRPVQCRVEIEIAATEIGRRRCRRHHRVRRLRRRSPVACREAGEERREDIAPLVVGGGADHIGLLLPEGRTARHLIGLGEGAVLPDGHRALAGRVQVGLQRGLAHHDVALGLAARVGAEHEVGAGATPAAGTEGLRRDGVGIILGVVPDAVGVGLAVGHARQRDVGHAPDRRQIGAPGAGRICTGSERAVGGRVDHRGHAVQGTVGRSAGRRIGEHGRGLFVLRVCVSVCALVPRPRNWLVPSS